MPACCTASHAQPIIRSHIRALGCVKAPSGWRYRKGAGGVPAGPGISSRSVTKSCDSTRFWLRLRPMTWMPSAVCSWRAAASQASSSGRW